MSRFVMTSRALTGWPRRALRRGPLLMIGLALALVTAACSGAPSTPRPSPVGPIAYSTLVPTRAPTPTAFPTPVPPTATPTPVVIAPTATAEESLHVFPPGTNFAAVKPAPFGRPQTLGGWVITPNKQAELPLAGSDKPRTGYVFIAITVSISNTAKIALPLNPVSAFSLVDAAKGGRAVVLTAHGYAGQITSQTIKPGGQVSGVVVMEASQAVKQWLLEFGQGPQAVRWTLGP